MHRDLRSSEYSNEQHRRAYFGSECRISRSERQRQAVGIRVSYADPKMRQIRRKPPHMRLTVRRALRANKNPSVGFGAGV